MDLFISLLFVVNQLRGAFSREATFNWFVVVVLGFCMRGDYLGGVTSHVRSLSLNPKHYQRLLNFFQTKSVNLERLTQLWVLVAFEVFGTFFVTLNGHPILVIDGVSIPKEGKSMPGVQLLHQSSESNSKPEFIMGHFFQAVGLLVGNSLSTIFCIPLFGRIHLGTKTTNRDKKTLYDKALSMLEFIPQTTSFYLVADAYYSTRKILSGSVQRGAHIISKVKLNAVAYLPIELNGPQRRGRPKKYGDKVKLRDIFLDLTQFTEMDSPVYGESGVKILVRSMTLLSRTLCGMELQYVFVIHPTRGKMILLNSDLSLDPIDVIRTYSYRFKIEVTFKSAIHNLGAFLYRFWSPMIDKTHRGCGTAYLHKKGKEYRDIYFTKLTAYEIYVQVAFIAQGILQYISLTQSQVVWKKFGTWIRTIRPNVLPSEMIVGKALRNQYIDFLGARGKTSNVQKFIREKVQIQEVKEYHMTG